MKKTYLHILRIMIVVSAALLSVSCIKEWHGEKGDGEGIVLTIKCAEAVTSKAGMNGTINGEARYNENKIVSVDLFFYPEGGTASNCVYHDYKTGLTADSAVDITTYTTDQLIFDYLVPGANTAFWVYVVVNYPGNIMTDLTTADRGTSVDAIKLLTINTDFAAPANHIQNSFVMDGLAHVQNVEKENRLVAKGLVNVKRLAAKITMQLSIADTVKIRKPVPDREGQEYDEKWIPMTGGMKMYLMDGVRNTTLEGLPVDNPVYFNYKNKPMYFNKIDESNAYFNPTYDADYPWLTDPTYVYPQRWEYASQDPPTMEPYLKLVLPWQRLANIVSPTTLQREFYYKIVIPDDTRPDDANGSYIRHFVRNNWYRFLLNVAMLGSETDEASVEVDASYYILDWTNQDIVLKHAEIGAARFLSVDPNEFVLNNVADLDILYNSSHPISVIAKNQTEVDMTATKIYYGTNNANTSYGGGTISTASNSDYPSGQKYITYNATQRKALNNGNDWVSIDGDHIHFYHALNNDITAGANFDSAPYIIHFNVYHEDHNNDTAYKESITIVQYPAMYITMQSSSGSYVFVNNYKATDATEITAYDDASPTKNSLSTIAKRNEINDSGDNTNPRQYTVYVTVLPSDSEFKIGDPRTDGTTPIVTTLTGINDSANYRPASEDLDPNILAPAIKIASSYGKTKSMTYDIARTRCAAYQENGYPAGRWRLPTKAEIYYLINLSENSIIPQLFTPDTEKSSGAYWCATGVVYPLIEKDWRGNITRRWIEYESREAAEDIAANNWPRCVYDVWYWGDTQYNSFKDTWSGYRTTFFTLE